MRLAFFTDIHIHDQFSVDQTIELLNNIKSNYSPDLFVGLGDFFDERKHLIQFGSALKEGIDALRTKTLLVYGNHDGSDDAFGGEGTGWDSFQEIFGDAQRSETIESNHFITMADMEPRAFSENFALEHAQPNSIIFRHSPISQKCLDNLAKAGIRYVFHGHLHMRMKMKSSDGLCEQISVSSFRFGGMDRTPPGCAIVDLTENGYEYTWALSNLPLLDGKTKPQEVKTASLDFYFHKDEERFFQQSDVNYKNKTFKGSYHAIQCWEDNKLLWDVKNGGPVFHDLCPLSTYKWKNKLYVFAGGTWIKRNGEFKSLRVHDGETGKTLYDISVVGLSVPPALEDNVAYISGQFRELIAFNIESGEVLWSTKCETETENLNWRDNRYGGGWSVTPVMIGQHLWVANFRGDLFGVEKKSGNFKFIHKNVLPMEDYGVYAYTLGFASENITKEKNSNEELIFNFNGIKVNDITGEILN